MDSQRFDKQHQGDPHDYFFWADKPTEDLARAFEAFKEREETVLAEIRDKKLPDIKSMCLMAAAYTEKLGDESLNLKTSGYASPEQIEEACQKYHDSLAKTSAMMERFCDAERRVPQHIEYGDEAIQFQNNLVDAVPSDLDEVGDSEQRKELARLAQLTEKLGKLDETIKALDRILEDDVTEDTRLLYKAAVKRFDIKNAARDKNKFSQSEIYQEAIDAVQSLIVKNNTMETLGSSQWRVADRQAQERILKTKLFALYGSMPHTAFRPEDIAFLESVDVRKFVQSNPALRRKLQAL